MKVRKIMSEQDILSIDAAIHNNLKNEIKKLPEYIEKIREIERSLELEKIRPRVRVTLETEKATLVEKVNDIENSITYNFYVMESAVLLDQYRRILEAPMRMSFLGKPLKSNKEKQRVINEYIEIAKKYIEIKLEVPEKNNKIICTNCPNKKDFDIIDGNIYICIYCSAQQVVLKHMSSYKDIDRVNISSRYTYDRKVHFRDCINQYQGKQNSTILQKVYDDLENQFELHHLLQGDKDTPKEIRFKNITKEHIGMFLKELEYTKHYENINLIHYNLTGVKPDDISHLEDVLLDDFDALTELYDKLFKNIDRKNFINTQYVLYQLLSRHKHPCVKEDFTILKTIDRKSFHDDVCKVLFEQLGFNLNPFF